MRQICSASLSERPASLLGWMDVPFRLSRRPRHFAEKHEFPWGTLHLTPPSAPTPLSGRERGSSLNELIQRRVPFRYHFLPEARAVAKVPRGVRNARMAAITSSAGTSPQR